MTEIIEIVSAIGATDAMSEGEPSGEVIESAPEPDDLAREWQRRIREARKHWDRFYRRCKHNRGLVQNFNDEADPNNAEFVRNKSNLILGSINTLLPAIYSRNPDIEVKPRQQNFKVGLFPKTLETVLKRQLDDAQLKLAATEAVRAALTCSYGVVKVLYQQDIRTDPAIKRRLEDCQENLEHERALLAQIEDDPARGDAEAKIAELEQTQRGLQAKLEVVVAQGLTVDSVLTENLIIDPAVESFDDYPQARWMAQAIPMERGEAEALYGKRLGNAVKYDKAPHDTKGHVEYAGPGKSEADGNSSDIICVLEIWDKRSQMVYTLAEGCDFFLRDPFPPPVQGRRFYPFFLLPYNKVNGKFIAPSLVDMTEKLNREHNDLRDKMEKHRSVCRPGYIVGNDVKREDIQSFAVAEVGEITQMKGLDSSEVQKGILPKQYPPVDGTLYDPTLIRQDWELVTGLQDAARASINKAKTATEAQIMSNSLSARISMFQDWTEEFLTELVQYAAQILLIELEDEDVHRLMGDGEPVLDPATGQPMIDPITQAPVLEKVYDWPTLAKEDVLEQISVSIRAGTTGKPNKEAEQENWAAVLPEVVKLIDKAVMAAQQNLDPRPYENLLKETLKRYDDSVDPKDFMPDTKAIMARAQQAMAAQQAQAAVPQIQQ